MRLICGLVRLDGAPAAADLLDAMVKALSTPGLSPRVSRRVDGPAALAMLDFAGGPSQRVADLPQSPDGTWLAADLRLDRAATLAAELRLQGNTGMDALALAALARWGEQLPDRLDGDFALAAWNPSERRLICSRDIMGVRPLCYTHRPGHVFAFASLPRGLYGSGVVPMRPDPVVLGQLMLKMLVLGPSTGFLDIAWVLAGHSVIVATETVRLHRAWRPDPGLVGRWTGNAADAAATLRHLTEEAVSCRLPTAGPLATHLSGGLDSSSITVIAARRMRPCGQRLYAWSLHDEPGAPGLESEHAYIDAVLAQEPDIQWAPVYLPPLDSEGVNDLDLPMGGPMDVPDSMMCAAARSVGAHLVLTGAGGDETASYNGIHLYADLLRSGRLGALWPELRARARRDQISLLRAIVQHLAAPLLPEWLREFRHRRRQPSQPYDRRAFLLSFLTPPLRERVAEALEALPMPLERNRPEDRIRMLADSYLVGRNNRWSLLGVRHGIAFTHPLLDRRIIDFSLSLPLERLLDGGFSRQPLRNAMTGILPDRVRLRRTKFNIFPNLALKLAAAKPGLLARLAALERQAAMEMFDLDAIATALNAIPEGAAAERAALAFNGGNFQDFALPKAANALRALVLAHHVAKLA